MKIKIAEHFYSIQGEGKTAGYPAIFIRFSGCNLLCGGANTQIDKKLHNQATWRCDTIESWMQGKEYELEDFTDKLLKTYDFKNKQIVITGGEPFLNYKHVKELIQNLELKTNGSLIKQIEIETNATFSPKLDEFFNNNLIQYNCSPKLKNSGMDKKVRYKPEVIQEFNALDKSIFKFVISNLDDCKEIETDYLPYINPDKIYLMPASDTRDNYIEKSIITAEFCKEFNFKFSPRHHLMIWDKKTGV